jgi:phosphohistidine phosphatase
MDLYIIRHAWAEERDAARWPDDGLRPLTGAGRKRFAEVVAKLSERDVAPSILATSPLVRCRQTADILAEGLPSGPEVVELAALEPGSDLETIIDWSAAQAEDHDQIGWVGHAPDVDRLCAALVCGDDAWIRFAKGSVAALRFDGPPAPGSGELRWLATAKVLGC